MCCWDHLDGIYDWKPLYELLKILACGYSDQLVLCPPMTRLVCDFPSLLTLPPTDLEWSASFFCLSSPSMYVGQFWISPPRELLRLWTDNCVTEKGLPEPPCRRAITYHCHLFLLCLTLILIDLTSKALSQSVLILWIRIYVFLCLSY